MRCSPLVRRAARALAVLLVLAEGAPFTAGQGARRPGTPARPRPPRAPAPPPAPSPDDEAAFYDDAARVAWGFVNRHVNPATGLVTAVADYGNVTVWDIGSGLAAFYCAHELGLLDDRGFDTRVRTLLRTLQRVPLVEGAVFNKVYSARSGTMMGRDRPTRRGSGWSAIDIGRLLVWLKILSVRYPQYADGAAAVVRRLDRDHLVQEGYLRGATLEAAGMRVYQEGRIGYEQYSGRGFAEWGFPVASAVDFRRNSVPIDVLGHTLLADLRGKDRLTGEPLAVLGLELGWTPEARTLAEELLGAMEERAHRTGHLTLLGEDAIARPPYYFYYYCAYAHGLEFVPDVQDPRAAVDGPRWASTKGAFAWHVLLPRPYTKRVLAAVAAARTPGGYASGLYEADGRSTGTPNVNTEAVILEAALVRARGGPILGTK